MVFSGDERYYELQQAVDNLDQDTLTDFSDYYAATEDWLTGSDELWLSNLIEQIDDLFATESTARDRLAVFENETHFRLDWAADFDLWLKDLRARAVRELAGDRSQPLVMPDLSGLPGTPSP